MKSPGPPVTSWPATPWPRPSSSKASDTVAKAFKLEDKADVLQRDDPGPFTAKSGLGCGTIILIAIIIIILLIILSNCSGSSGSGYRSSGGSFGGYSSGGSHK